jgi:transcriptional regulator with XRE-family HTH domain
MTIGMVIKTLRASAGLQQQELAARVGISPSFLSLIERDKRDPTVRLLREIGNALGVPPGVLVAAALQSDTPAASAEAAKIDQSIRSLVRAAHHYVLSKRLNEMAVSLDDGKRRNDSMHVRNGTDEPDHTSNEDE